MLINDEQIRKRGKDAKSGPYGILPGSVSYSGRVKLSPSALRAERMRKLIVFLMVLMLVVCMIVGVYLAIDRGEDLAEAVTQNVIRKNTPPEEPVQMEITFKPAQ